MRFSADVRAAVVRVRQVGIADRLPDRTQSRRCRCVGLCPSARNKEGVRCKDQQEQDDPRPQDQQRQRLAALIWTAARCLSMSVQAPRPARPRGNRGEAGGSVTLMVMLMVPVCVLAAVVAAAVPRRLAAESATEAAADNLASLAVVWRDAQGSDHGPVSWFLPDCAPSSGETPADEAAGLDLELQRACEALTEPVLAGLSARGVDGTTVEGFYSSAYTASAQTTAEDGEHPISLPCHAGGRAIVADAVHLGLAADWATTDWAAGQVWPQGLRLGDC